MYKHTYIPKWSAVSPLTNTHIHTHAVALWWGIWMAAAPYVPKWCAVSPLWVTLLLVGVSGIPIMEKKYNEKFVGDHPLTAAYAQYKASTSILVPLPKF